MSLKRAKEIIDVFEQQKKLGRFGRGEVFIIELLYELIDSVESTKEVRNIANITKAKK